MRVIFLLAVICVATTCADHREYDPEALSLACEDESNFHLDYISYADKIKDGSVTPSEEFYRFMACIITNGIDAAKGDENIHDFFMRNLDSFEEDLQNLENVPFNREEIELLANRCAREGLDGVDYLKCIKILQQPLVNLLYINVDSQN